MKNVYTVKQVNSYIKNMFTQDFMLNRIYVKGEVSNCKVPHIRAYIFFIERRVRHDSLRDVRRLKVWAFFSYGGRTAGSSAGGGQCL